MLYERNSISPISTSGILFYLSPMKAVESNLTIWITAILSTKQATVFCFLLALLNKIIIAIVFTDLQDDKSLYMLFARNLLDGNGFTEPIYLATGGQVNRYVPASISPVYSFIAAPILLLSGSYNITSGCLDILAWIVFFTGLFKIARVVLKDRVVINLLLIAVGFFLYPHEFSSGPKDTLAVGLILWCCYYCYLLVQDDKWKLKRTLGASILFTLLAGTKFLYSPLILVFLVLLIVLAIRKKNPIALKSAIIICVITGIAVFWWLFYLDNLKASAVPVNFISNREIFIRGFFLKNLELSFPFISSSILNTNFIGVQIENILQIPFSDTARFFCVLDGFMLFFFAALILSGIKRLIRSTLPLILISTAIVICFMVAYMSVKYDVFKYGDSHIQWTYVSDARSFLIPMIILQLGLFYFAFIGTGWLKKIALAFVILIFLECFHGLYFTIKQLIQFDVNMKQSKTESPIKSVVEMVKEEPKSNTHLITSFDNMRRYAMLNGVNAYPMPMDCSKVTIQKDQSVYIVTYISDSKNRKKCFLPGRNLMAYPFEPFIIHFYK